jgi:UDP-N-acetylmuramyl tripeptide synthase
VDPVFVQEKLKTIATNSLVVVANRDDKNLCQFLEGRSSTFGFGLSDTRFESRPEYAINFGTHPELTADGIVVGAGKDGLELKLGAERLNLSGDYSNLTQALNVAGAVLAASKLVPLDLTLTKRTIEALPPVFARDEIATIRGRDVRLMLVQNPTSFQLNINKFAEQPSPLMMMAGRDIHDPSWLWTVDFSSVKHVDIVSGFNANELALRLHFAGVDISHVIPEIDKANELFATMNGPTPTIVFSADAMRRTRRYLGLAK